MSRPLADDDWPATGLFRVRPIFTKGHKMDFSAPSQATQRFGKCLILPGNFI
jgi:hypothetical protein